MAGGLRIHGTANGRSRPTGREPEPATILVRGLAARTFIGINPGERRKRQDVVIDLAVEVRTSAGRSDRIEDAVDYKGLKDAVLRYVEGTRHDLLEALAQGIADRCLRHPGVEAVEVEVDKPGALRFARSVAVRIRRTRRGPSHGIKEPGGTGSFDSVDSAAGPVEAGGPAGPATRPARAPRPRNWGHRG